MRTQKRPGGFTIIEVMLFLAITGALSVAILVGSGMALGQSRYRDSVNSFKGLIQEQYGQIANVVNSEDQKPICIRAGDNLLFDMENDQDRGTSDCLIIGRFLLIDGDETVSYNVVGEPGASVSSGDDTAVLSEYALALQSPEVQRISWGARIVEPESGENSLTSLLIIRSQVSGTILTYVMEGDQTASPGGMIQEGAMVEKSFCVDSTGGSGTTKRMAVRINARAANQSAIEIPLENEGICD